MPTAKAVFVKVGDYIVINGIAYKVTELMPNGVKACTEDGKEKIVSCLEIQYYSNAEAL